MEPSELRQRERKLEQLAQKLAEPLPARRKQLSKPQPLLMHTGDLVTVCVDAAGRCRNPYARDGDDELSLTHWSAFVVARAHLAFGYLAVYAILNLGYPLRYDHRPSVEELMEATAWMSDLPGTCSRAHFRRMGLEIAGRVPIDPAKLAPAAHHFDAIDAMAAQDISLSSRVSSAYQALDGARFGPLASLA